VLLHGRSPRFPSVVWGLAFSPVSSLVVLFGLLRLCWWPSARLVAFLLPFLARRPAQVWPLALTTFHRRPVCINMYICDRVEWIRLPLRITMRRMQTSLWVAIRRCLSTYLHELHVASMMHKRGAARALQNSEGNSERSFHVVERFGLDQQGGLLQTGCYIAAPSGYRKAPNNLQHRGQPQNLRSRTHL
jgi:hypothetical protein